MSMYGERERESNQTEAFIYMLNGNIIKRRKGSEINDQRTLKLYFTYIPRTFLFIQIQILFLSFSIIAMNNNFLCEVIKLLVFIISTKERIQVRSGKWTIINDNLLLSSDDSNMYMNFFANNLCFCFCVKLFQLSEDWRCKESKNEGNYRRWFALTLIRALVDWN